MLSSLRVTCAVVVLLGIDPCMAAAQSSEHEAPSATLAGIVVDATSAAVPGVSIAALNTETGIRRETISIRDGTFLIPLLPDGQYLVTARRNGFAPLEVHNVVL